MPIKLDSITNRDEMTDEEAAATVPLDIEKRIDDLVSECQRRDVDIMVYAKKKGADGMMTTGWNSKRTRMEVYMTVGLRLGIPEEVLAITAMAAMSGHEMKVASAEDKDDLVRQIMEEDDLDETFPIIGNAPKDKQIH